MIKTAVLPKSKLKDGGRILLSFGLSEAKFDDSNDSQGKPKHEIVITAFQEGPGNERDRRWYSREAVDHSEPIFYARRKLFTNHLREGQSPSDEDLKNWCATMKETWTETNDQGRLARKVRLKIHEDWLWRRCQEAPEEIALSIEGAGAGREGIMEGKTYMIIEKILSLNATKFVTYPGNAKMGADLVESEAKSTTEESNMDLKELSIAMIKEHRPDLIEALTNEVAAPLKAKIDEASAAGDAKNGDMTKFQAQLAEQVTALKSSFNATIDELRSKLSESDRKLDAAEVRERLRGKKELVERKLAGSALAVEAKTPRFIERLLGLSEKKIKDDKGSDKILTVDEQVDIEIAEQIKLTTADFGSIRPASSNGNGSSDKSSDGQLTEEEQQVIFNHVVLKAGPSLQEHRAAKAKELEEKKAVVKA